MSGLPVVLLPPSEGKASGGDRPPFAEGSLSFPELDSTRNRIAVSLRKAMRSKRKAGKLLGVKDAALERAIEENATVLESPTMPAIQRYSGVMYDAIDYASLDESARRHFDESVLIMSGLFGLVRPQDAIPAYKLKMGTALTSKTCAATWKRSLTKVIADEASGRDIWDLLPNEHSAAWDPSKAPYRRRFTVKFVQETGGKLKTVNHWSKLLKGALVRYIVSQETSDDSIESILASFTHPEGYEFDPELSELTDRDSNLLFVKR